MSVSFADTTLEFVADVESSDAEDGGSHQMFACSQILRLASPVMDAMLASQMVEAQEKHIKIDSASKAQFETFYLFLLPGSGRKMRIEEGNVDLILPLSDYYQVESLKAECEAYLLDSTVSVPRLIQAHEYGLHEQYTRCLAAIAEDSEEHDIKALMKYPEVLMQLTVLLQNRRSAAKATTKQKLEALRDYAWDGIPNELLFEGQRVHEKIHNEFDEFLRSYPFGATTKQKLEALRDYAWDGIPNELLFEGQRVHEKIHNEFDEILRSYPFG